MTMAFQHQQTEIDLQRSHTQNIEAVDRNLILNGDCETQLDRLADQCIDVVVTSPPYNIGVRYGSYTDDLPRSDYLDWIYLIAGKIQRVMKYDASLFLNVGSTNVDPWIAFDVANKLRDLFFLQNNITWIKSVSINEDTVGHFKPISSKRFLNNNLESVFHFTKTGSVPIDRIGIGVPYKDKSNIARRGHSQDRRCAGNVWFLPYQTVHSKSQKFNHPAGFPEALPARCIAMHGGADLRVLDPFMGTGTTLIAAKNGGHSGIGIEIDPVYVETALQRLGAD